MEGVVGLFSWCCFVQGKVCTRPLSAEMGILSPLVDLQYGVFSVAGECMGRRCR